MGETRQGVLSVAEEVRAVVFDFDYTLVDSSAGVIECVNHALARQGLAPASPEAVRRTIGLHLPDCFAQLTGEEPGETQELVRAFVARADEVMTPMTVLFEPVPRMVTALRRCGLRLGIVSTKYRYRIEGFLDEHGLRRGFDAIAGLEDVPAPKPDPAGLLATIGRLDAVPEAALYVGDSVVDAETAQRARVRFVAVLSGVTPRRAFAPYPAFATLDSVGDLPALLRCEAGEEQDAGDGRRG